MTASISGRRWRLISLGASALLACSPLLPAQTGDGNPQSTPATPSKESKWPEATPKQRANAEDAYLAGAKHLRDSRFPEAEREFARAVSLDPARPEYLQALLLAREHHITDLLQQAAQKRSVNPAAADALLDQARKLDGTNPRVVQHDPLDAHVPRTAVRSMRAAGTTQLQPNASRHSYHERADLRSLASHIARDFGFRVSFDPDVRSQSFRLDMDDVSFSDAMSVFTMLTKTMWVPLDAHTVVLAMDTQENRQRYERLVEETYPLPGMTADQMKDFVSIAQNVLSIRQVSVEPNLGALVLRGPADQVNAAEQVFADLLQDQSEVVLDLKLYSIDQQRVRNLGVMLPQSLSAFSLASQAQSIVSQNSALISQLIASGVIPATTSVYQLAAYLVFAAGISGSSLFSNSFLIFGGGATTGVLSVGNIPTINLALSQSDARTLDDVQLRASDRQTVIFKSGTRYPIQTSLFSDIASSTAGALGPTTVNGVSLSNLLSSYLGTSNLSSSAVIPQVQYEDLGLTVTAIPHVQRTGEVGMHLEVKVTALAGTALNGIPVLASQQFTSDLTIQDGETAMMISNTTDSETAAVTGVPGLSELPGFQSTTNRNSTKITGDLVLMITPHIVRHGHTSAAGPYIPLPSRPDDD